MTERLLIAYTALAALATAALLAALCISELRARRRSGRAGARCPGRREGHSQDRPGGHDDGKRKV